MWQIPVQHTVFDTFYGSSGPKNNDRAATLGQCTEGDGHPGDHDDFHGTVHYAKHYAVLYTNMVD
jgi:hypothetical protein